MMKLISKYVVEAEDEIETETQNDLIPSRIIIVDNSQDMLKEVVENIIGK